VELVPGEPRQSIYWGWPVYEHFRDRNQVFSAVSGTSFDNLVAVRLEGAGSETLIQETVPGNYFRILGRPAIGRLIGPEDVASDGDGDVSWLYRNGRLHRDRRLGKRVFVGDAPKTINGVPPRAYVGPRVGVRTDIGTVVAGRDAAAGAVQDWCAVPIQAAAESSSGGSVDLEPAGTGLARVRGQYGKPLVLVLAAVGLLLLLTCIRSDGSAKSPCAWDWGQAGPG